MSYTKSLDWAGQHLERLRNSIQDFLKTDPYVLVTKDDPRTRDKVICVTVQRSLPDEWPFMIGDCLHNQRFALDHLAWTLVHANTSTPSNERRIQFPIFDSAPEYQRAGIARIVEASIAVQTAIETLQPYHGWHTPEPHPLLLFNELINVHKHRHLLAAGSVMAGSRCEILQDPLRRLRLYAGMNRGAFEDGQEIFRYGVSPPGPAPEIKIDYKTSFDVAFSQVGPARGAPVIQVLEGVDSYIRNTVFPQLEPFT